jgi:hypothetical protein
MKRIADQIAQMLDRFQQRLTLDNPRFIEHYIKSELHFLVHLFVAGTSEEYVACLQGKQIIGWPNKVGWKVCEGMILFAEHFSGPIPEVADIRHEVNTLKSGANGDQQSVLVNNIELMKDPQFVPLTAFVWLDTAKHIYSIWPQVLYYSLKSSFEIKGTIPDNELVPRSGTGLAVRPDKKQLLGNVVNNTAQVMNRVASGSRNRSRHGVSSDYIMTQLAHLRIVIGSDFIRLGIEEGFDLGFKINDVLFGPFNFYLDEHNPFIGSHGFDFLGRD